MTNLTKPIKRRVPLILDNRKDARDRDNIVVTLYPGGIIGFRANRCRREYTLSLTACYNQAIQAGVKADRAEKAKRGKGKSG